MFIGDRVLIIKEITLLEYIYLPQNKTFFFFTIVLVQIFKTGTILTAQCLAMK